MDGSPSSVVSLGFGSWGSTGLVLTLGLGIGAASLPHPLTCSAIRLTPRLGGSASLTPRLSSGNQFLQPRLAGTASITQ